MGIADELITRGWRQGDAVGDDGSVCLAGAMSYAAGDDLKLAERMSHLVRGLTPDGTIVVYNDDLSRTFDEVLRVAKQADELLDAQRLTGEI